MDSPKKPSSSRVRPASAVEIYSNNCPNLNVNAPPTPPVSRSPLSTVAVQAVFHKSRSHSEKPSASVETPPTFGAREICILTEAQDSDLAQAVTSPERAITSPHRTLQVHRTDSEDTSVENPRSQDNEPSMRSSPVVRSSNEAGTLASNSGRDPSVISTREKYVPTSNAGRIQCVAIAQGQVGTRGEQNEVRPNGTGGEYGGNANYLGGAVPQPPPPPQPSPGTNVRNGRSRVLKDPACDPDNPYVLQFQDVTSAAFMIRNAITITPCVHSRVSRMVGMEVFLKKDFMQLTGSFKERGARYALLKLTPEQRATGIVAASLGNHALALACHGGQLGIPVTVVMPTRAPLAKASACRAYGANLIIEGDNLGESRSIALDLAERKGVTYINGYDHPHILAGQGTLGLELLEQVCDVDAIVIPVGGGGLLAGVATAAKTLYPNIKIIAVESENCPSFSAAKAAGKPVLVESRPTIADGLAVPMVGVNAFASAAPLVDRTIVVNEDLIALSILRMVEVEKNVVEGAGAAGIAAVLSGQMVDFKGKRVVILACGGNIDVSMLGRCLERGLVMDGRLLSFTVFVDQNPTSLSDLFSVIERVGASIKDMTHDRKWESENFFHFPVKMVVETPGAASSRELRTALTQMYKKIYFHHNIEPITSHYQPMYPDFPRVECGGTEKCPKKATMNPSNAVKCIPAPETTGSGSSN